MTQPATLHIWPIAKLRERLNSDDGLITSVKIYSGHGSRGIVISDIRKKADGTWPQSQLDFLEEHTGQLTAVISPTREMMFLENAPAGTMNFGYPNFFGFNGAGAAAAPDAAPYMQLDTMQLVNKLIAADKKISELEAELKAVKEDLEEFEDKSGMFQHAFIGVVEKWLYPMVTGNSYKTNTKPMQGSEDWTSFDVAGKTGEEQVKAAMQVIYMAFGAENLAKMAIKLQKQPHLVNTLTAML